MAQLPQAIGEEEIVYQGKIIEVVHQKVDEGTRVIEYEMARRSPGTRLIIISPDNKILLIKTYRVELKDWDIRLPGGKVIDSLADYNEFLKTGNDMLPVAMAAAKKEAREEAGIDVKTLEHIATSKCGATVEWDLYYFVVKDFVELAHQELESGEHIELTWVSLDEAKQIALSGHMSEDRSVAVVLRYLNSL